MLYSIGHGTRPEQDFMDLLKHYHSKYLVDVRSLPRSRFNPQFNRKALEHSLAHLNVKYVFMGDTLGGRPDDPSCYVDGKISYHTLGQKDFYLSGIERLMKANDQDLNLAIMCSERKPQDCHRSRLIGKTLLGKGINLQHINEQGEIISQSQLQNSHRL